MITRTEMPWQAYDWQHQLADAIRDPDRLLAALGLNPALLPAARAAAARFPLLVPASYLARIRPGRVDDPLLRQILPLGAELSVGPNERVDPVGDLTARQAPGVLSKYRGRALLIATPACAIHCRYCFRRDFPYRENQAGRGRWQAALDWLGTHTDVSEVILSGGDPLTLDDHRLAELIDALGQIPHLRRLRLHTRLPVVIPDRVTEALAVQLSTSRLSAVVVIHANHPAEINTEVRNALAGLKTAGIPLLNQSVLLAGINDAAETLALLSETLFEAGVLPYYLHQLDPAVGTDHFAVSDDRARDILGELRARLPGYLVPRLVRELPGETAKRPL
ncbi:MAG: EF-P beta-lysylation protein EpmB [Chromatiales bacterium]|nr:EF-P beta-lysylation protein EpmB [Chromatiales bacterium]